MTACSSAISAGMALASPEKRSWLAIPSLNRLPKPVFEDLYIIDMMSLYRSPDDDALHGFGPIEPGSSTRGL
jgi:hypothetical protein